MFGFGKRKNDPPPRSGRRSSDGNREQTKAQLNIFGIGDEADLEVDDADLEDELLSLLGEGGGGGKKAKSPQRRAPAPASVKKPVIDPFAIPDVQDQVGEDDDEDDDIDETELEAELADITGLDSSESNFKTTDDTAALISITPEPPSRPAPPAPPSASGHSILQILQERLAMYEKAKEKADSTGDSAKSRRFTRAIKTLKELIGKAKAGKAVDENDIPPAVSIGDAKSKPEEAPPPPVVPPRQEEIPVPVFEPIPPVPPRVSKPPQPDSTESPAPPPLPPRAEQPSSIVTERPPVDPAVEARLKDYKRMAVGLKRAGDPQGGVKYLKLAKALEAAINSGAPVDLSAFPSLPEATEAPKPQEDAPAPPPVPSTQDEQPAPEVPPPAAELFGAPPPPTTVMEALEQRLEKYKSEVEKANAASNSSKARRMGRIVKQYEEAIVLYKKGKPVPYDELPTPPGFAPIPVPGSTGASVSAAGGVPAAPPPSSSSGPGVAPQPTTPKDAPSTGPSSKPGAVAAPGTSPATPGPSKSPGSGQGSINRAGKPATKLTLQEKQLNLILERQRQYKEAAIAAKKRGDVDQARELLRTAKGFDKLIEASRSGLPVEMNTLPCPPQAVEALEAENFEIISGEDCFQPEGGAAEVFAKLEEDLKNQLKMCMRMRDHYRSAGDIASANKFERLAIESKRDLDTLRLAAKQGGTLPKYHYESRVFSITECNTDLTEDEIEISVIKGISYKVSNPDDVDTYVRVELPYPSAEEAQVNKTGVVKDTNNPEYNATFKMSINRNTRFQRFVHRHGFKLEVWSKGGFLRGSTLIGTATAKLMGLETKCTVHEAVDIMEGRKSVGKLEVKIRLRDPVLAKQITQKKEKWLSIDRA